MNNGGGIGHGFERKIIQMIKPGNTRKIAELPELGDLADKPHKHARLVILQPPNCGKTSINEIMARMALMETTERRPERGDRSHDGLR